MSLGDKYSFLTNNHVLSSNGQPGKKFFCEGKRFELLRIELEIGCFDSSKSLLAQFFLQLSAREHPSVPVNLAEVIEPYPDVGIPWIVLKDDDFSTILEVCRDHCKYFFSFIVKSDVMDNIDQERIIK